MKRFNLKSMVPGLVNTWNRFYIVVIFVLVLAVLSLLEINNKDFELEFNIWGFFILGAVSMLSVSLFSGFFRSVASKIGVAVAVLALVGTYTFIFFDSTVEWEQQQFAAILGTVILTLFFVLFLKPKTDKSFWVFVENNSREFISILIYAAILYGGLALAVYAVEELFSIQLNDKIYGNLAMICFQLLAPIYFLTTITPQKLYYSNTLQKHQFLRILGLYILLPVLALYLIILYIYLFKIIISWQLPNGWVSSLVSVLALGGYLAKFLLFPLSNYKLVRFLNKYFSALLLPLVVLMTVGLLRRIDDYGLTVNRLYVLVFNVWLYGVSIYLYFTNSKSLRWLVISFSIVLFTVSVGPWSVFSITKRVVAEDIKTMLIDSKLIRNEKLVSNSTNKLLVSDSVAVQLSDKIQYFVRYYGMENWKATFAGNKSFENAYAITEYLGVNDFKIESSGRFVHGSLPEGQYFNVSEYRVALTNLHKVTNSSVLFSNPEYKVKIDGLLVNVFDANDTQLDKFDLKPILIQLNSKPKSDKLNEKVLVKHSEHALLVIHSLAAERLGNGGFKLNELNISLYVE